MRLTTGSRLGPYEVLSFLGSGGMAEVYRARDTRLGRDVALKVVNESLASDPDLIRRLEQEARLAGSLNHPNLVTVHDAGSVEGMPYLVTELLRGESLRDRLSRGPLPLLTALDFAAQLARGLSAAHGRGVLHRDVKPGNVFLVAGGPVKLFDFGIAKRTEASAPERSHALMETTLVADGIAHAGSLLGTPGYMAPEQVRGEALDPRTDLFSLGALLHEMLSGQRAFPGASVVERGYAVLHADPAPLPGDVPVAVVRVVVRCLEKEPSRRFQSADDLAFGLDLLREPTATPPVPAAMPRSRFPVRALLALAALITALGVALAAADRWGRSTPLPPEVERLTFRWGRLGGARFLPDGRVAFSAAFEGRPEDLYIRAPHSAAAQSLGLSDLRLVAASAQGDLAVMLHPKYSPPTRQGTLAQVPSAGGTPRELVENVEYADWSPTGELAVVRQSGLARTLEFPLGHVLFRTEGWISNPRFSSRGDLIAFLHHPVRGDDLGEVVVVDLKGQARTLSRRFPTSYGLAWSPDDREVWFTGGIVQKNRLVAVSLGGGTRDLYRSLSEMYLDDVSKDGQVLLDSLLERAELVYAGDGSGAQTLLSWTDWTYPLAALSADGKALFSTLETIPTHEGQQPSWVTLRGTDGSPAQVLGAGLALDLSADGRWALAASDDLRTLTALPTGVGEPRVISTGALQIAAGRWTADGSAVLVTGAAPGEDHVRLYRLAGEGSSPLRVSEVALSHRRLLQLSRDGRWAAAVREDLRPVLISLRDGAALPVLGAGTDAPTPRGWSPEGNLWITEGGGTLGAHARLILLAPRTGRLLEERSIAPSDPGGAGTLTDLVLSPDGRKVAFTYTRSIGSLYIVRGLNR